MNDKSPSEQNSRPRAHDVHHDASPRDLNTSPSGGNPPEYPDDVSRDQNHDESRINAFDPEVAKGLKADDGSGCKK